MLSPNANLPHQGRLCVGGSKYLTLGGCAWTVIMTMFKDDDAYHNIYKDLENEFNFNYLRITNTLGLA
jgi:hypothetical protein